MRITIRAKSEIPKSYTYRDCRIYDNGTTFDVYKGKDKIAGDFGTSDEAETYIDEDKDNITASTKIKITASSVDDSEQYKDLYRPITEEEKIDEFNGDVDACKEAYDEMIDLYDEEGYEYLGTYISDDEFLRDAGLDVVDLVKTSKGDKRFVFTVSDSIYYANDEIDRALDSDSEEYGYSSDEY